MSPEDLVSLENVTVERDGVTILRNLTVAIRRQSLTAVVGPNGAGKTTFLHTLLGLAPISKGAVHHPPREKGRRLRVGFVPQRLDMDRTLPITVLDFLVLTRQTWPLWLGIGHRQRQDAMAALERVQATYLVDRPLGKLSGGETQRVLLAFALQDEPELIVLDEPVSGVDLAGEKLFCDLLEALRQTEHLTIVLVSHDLSVVYQHASHVICLKDGQLHCQGPTLLTLSETNLATLYGPQSRLYPHFHAARNQSLAALEAEQILPASAGD